MAAMKSTDRPLNILSKRRECQRCGVFYDDHQYSECLCLGCLGYLERGTRVESTSTNPTARKVITALSIQTVVPDQPVWSIYSDAPLRMPDPGPPQLHIVDQDNEPIPDELRRLVTERIWTNYSPEAMKDLLDRWNNRPREDAPVSDRNFPQVLAWT